MFVVYGECGFPSNGQRNAARNAVTSYASTNGLTGYAYDVYPAGVGANATIDGRPGFRFSFSTASIATAEAAEAAANQALQANNYDGMIAHAEVQAR